MDPNVQVAIATVVGTAITTLGIVIVAMINTRRADKEDSGEEAEPTDALDLIRSLVMENARKERTIISLKKENERLRAQQPKEEIT